MISTADFRNGMTIEMDGTLYNILYFQHVKPGKGGAFVRSRLKNLKTGAVQEKTFRAGEKVELAVLDKRKMQFLYEEGGYHFMDTETFEQMTLAGEDLGEPGRFLKEGTVVDVSLYEGRPVGVELPIFVELEVVEAAPGVKGDTASGGSKSVVLETGASVQVPLFMEAGNVVKIDTRTGEYVGRVD